MEDLSNRFVYHAPKGDQAERYQELRTRFLTLALHAQKVVPASREQSLGMTNLEQALMWFNAGIARNE